MLQDVARATANALIENVKTFKNPGMPDHTTYYCGEPETAV